MRARVSLAALALFFAACSKPPTALPAAAESGGVPAVSDADASVESADAAWELRAEEASLKEALAQYEAIAKADPSNRHALVRLTRGWYFWGDAFTQDEDAKIERWGKAIAFGTQCIALNKEVASQLQGGAKEKDAIQAARKEDAGCIYWSATALGKWGKIQSLSKTLKHLPTVKAYVAKVDELDPTYYHYGPARYWAAYYSALPSFAGQDYEKSAQYFDAAIEAAPYYLPTRVLRAEYLAVGTQDVAMFDKDLAFVLAADPAMKPDAGITAENIKDIDKARALLEKRGEFFDQKAIDAAAN